MRKILLLTLFFANFLHSKSQQLSFTCPRDTVLGCGVNCFNLSARFPDLRALGTDYTISNISNISGCRPYVDPGSPGPSTNLIIDDRYSSVLPLPFSFPFYGTSYNSLIASTNGFVSFDVSKTGLFSHYTNNGNLPNTLYDPAIIMGPYHDLDPSISGSPTQQIKYEVFGSAPNRKWILSFYKVPLFGSSCVGLINNTHQIILHETTGIIEVVIIDKEVCTGWNSGKSMVGIQDFTKTKGVMAPNRQMSDPTWGTIGMNETWRFVPIGGAPLYRSVELLDATGATIAVGDTVRVDATTLECVFPNVCPPSNTQATYVVKTTYARLNDLTSTIYSLDTVRVLRNAMPASASSVNTTCGATVGSITMTASGGTLPYTYTLNPGGITNSTGLFTGLGTGTYTISVSDASGVCSNMLTKFVGITGSLAGTATSTNASCPGVNNGSVIVTPSAGTAPYTFSANSGPTQASGTFINLAPGTYSIVFTDALGCNGSVIKTITPGSNISGSSTSTATSCAGAPDGTITITASLGVGPYTYSLDAGAYQSNNTFTGVSSGSHIITIMDSRGCTITISKTVTAGSSLTGNIFQTNLSCSGANDGTVTLVPVNGVAPYVFLLDGGTPQSSGTFTGVTAGLHTATFTDANGCSGSRSINVGAGAATSTGASTTSTSCPGALDGVITIVPVTGAVYTLTPGNITSSTGIFTGLGAGTYSATYTVPPTTCVGTVTPTNLVVGAGPALVGTAFSTATSCPTVGDGTITVTSPNSAGSTFTLNPGGITNSTGIFTGLTPNTYSISFVTASGCTGNVSPLSTVLAGPFLTSSSVTVNPVCSGISDGSISITPQAGTAGPYTVTLTGTVGSTTLIGNAPVVFPGLAPGTYSYDYTSANGCTGVGGPITLTTNDPIMAPALTTMPLCKGNANGIVVFNPFGGVSPYQYSINGGISFQSSNSFNGLTAGTHNFRIKDNVGCIKDTSVILSEPNLLTASASNTLTAGCSNNDGTITTIATGGTTPLTYSITAGPTTNGSGSTSGVFLALASGTYTVSVTDAMGCITTANTSVILVDNMHLTLGRDSTICVESSITLNPITNPETSIFAWRSTNAPITTLNNPTIKNAIATPTDTSTYILHAQWGTCSREDTIVVNILHKPVAHAGKDTAICNISYAILRGSASNLSGTVNYAWSPTAGVQIPTQSTTTVYPAGNDTTYIYTLFVKDNYGCNFTVSDQVSVRVQPPVPAYAGNDSIAVRGVAHQLFGTGGVNYLWSPSSPLNSPIAQNPMATLLNDTRFVLKVTDFAGCIGFDTVFIQVYNGPNYFIPNAFSPNGDGLNDVFRAIPVGIVNTEWFRIFNRYGEMIFQTNQWLKGWDGFYKGKKQPVGNYIWIIKGTDKNGKNIEMKGTVMLML